MIRGWSLILYGTSGAPDPNDPPNVPRVLSTPQPVLPPIIPASGYAGYSVGSSKNFYATGGSLGKPNRKQQLQYATYTPAASQFGMTTMYQAPPAAATPPRKNKNKNKPNKNSSKTTTVRPNGGQTTLGVFANSYGKKFDAYANGNKKTGTSKPKPPASQNSNYNRNEKFNAASSTIYEKQVAIKAPKQVKDSNSQTPSRASSRKPISVTSTTNLPSSPVVSGSSTTYTGTTSLTTQPPFFNERFSTTNARIPKLFQQYEKIQQFYPELKPYSSIRDDLDRPPAPNQPSQVKLSSTLLSPANASGPIPSSGGSSSYPSAMVTNGKPSRANTKIFFPDTDIIDAIGPRKISSSLQPIQPFYGRTQSSQFVSSGSKSGKGTGVSLFLSFDWDFFIMFLCLFG